MFFLYFLSLKSLKTLIQIATTVITQLLQKHKMQIQFKLLIDTVSLKIIFEALNLSITIFY